MLAYIVAVLPVGLPVLADTFRSWRDGSVFNEFTLMVAAAIGAFLIGEYPEGVAVLLFYSFGERLEDAAGDSARNRIRSILSRLPRRVKVEGRGEIEPEHLVPGDLLVVLPGERVAADGVLRSDTSADFDLSAITGESLPVSISPGGEVLSGALPADREVRVEVTRRYSDSSMSRIMAMIEEAAARKSSTETMLRRITRYYTPIVMGLSVALFLLPWLWSLVSPGFDFVWRVWLERALVLLVCSCPCALVVSVPLSYFAAIGRASSFGVLFKGSRYIDALRDVDTLLLDKTGTLTTGMFSVVEVFAAPGASRDDVLRMGAALDSRSNHPLARAVCEAAGEWPEASGVLTVTHGVTGVIGSRSVAAGSRSLMEALGVAVDAPAREGASEVCVAVDGALLGVVYLADTLRADAARTLAGLRRAGVKHIEVLSGDREEAVAAAAREAGADAWRSALRPDDKHGVVFGLKEAGRHVAFVGDGINDAPSLALADVGIAIGTGGTDIAMESADAVITGHSLARLVDALLLSKRLHRVVIFNVVLAIGVKAAVMLLGALGWASLWAAVFADTGITLITVLITLLALRPSRLPE